MASTTGTLLWTRDGSDTAAGGSEVVAFDPRSGLVLALGPTGVEALDASDGTFRFNLPRADLGPLGTGNSVAVHGDVVAVAYDGLAPGSDGTVAFYGLAADGSGAALIRQVQVGAVPDMVAFTQDGSRLLVAIEGEPNAGYGVDASGDPAGGVAVIDVSSGASTFLGFGGFDTEALRAAGVRITGVAGVTAATDLEPEYIAISADGTKAYVTLQENNAIAVLDLDTLSYTNIFALGTKDHSAEGNGLDPSDRDGGPGIVTAPVRGMYMPDGIASFERDGRTYLVTANEGDATEWGGYSDLARVSALDLDEASFGGAAGVAAVQAAAALGRLEVSAVDGDTDGDGDIDVLHALGGRSFSIWEATETGLVQTYDSGDLIERMLLQARPDLFDDNRSDSKGPEPESIAVGVVEGQLYAFVALERADSVMSFAINSPSQVEYAGLIATEDAPEVIRFVPAGDAPAGTPLLISPNEGSGVTTAHALASGTGNAPQTGGPGDDALAGQDGGDVLAGLGGNDTLSGGAGPDRIEGGAGTDLLYGGTEGDGLEGGAGDDVVLGEAGNDRLTGGQGRDTVAGGLGDDTASGGEGADLLSGQAGDDSLGGDAGDDVLAGEAGRDTLSGGEGNDLLLGGEEADELRGGAGADLIIGEAGDDRLFGEEGNDEFVFAPGSGRDTISGFGQSSADDDVIRFAPGSFDRFERVVANTRQDGSDVVITGGLGDTVTLVDVSLLSLTPSDFIFG